jgi:predicted transcriptional regulator
LQEPLHKIRRNRVTRFSESRFANKSIRELALHDLKKTKKYPHTWRRSRPEMVRDMLRCLPEKVTRIAYGANLSWHSMIRLLRFCEDKTLVICKNGLWYLTEQGQHYLEAYRVIETVVEP